MNLILKKRKERKKLRKEQRDAGEDVSSDEEEENIREAFGAPQCEQEGRERRQAGGHDATL